MVREELWRIPMTVWAYYRVSSNDQNYESQKIGVIDYANKNHLKIDKEIIDDGISGTALARNRNLNIILNNAKKGKIVEIYKNANDRNTYEPLDCMNTCNIIAGDWEIVDD